MMQNKKKTTDMGCRCHSWKARWQRPIRKTLHPTSPRRCKSFNI